ncbi:MAG: hypothetical protein HOV79_06960 [Hamadaea sp.]|nr:hypothetical protein [Hamadaea sp.]
MPSKMAAPSMANLMIFVRVTPLPLLDPSRVVRVYGGSILWRHTEDLQSIYTFGQQPDQFGDTVATRTG